MMISYLSVSIKILRVVAICGAVILVYACGGTGQTQQELPNVTAANDTAAAYDGPVAETQDIRNFQLFFWSALNAQSRCGACHANDQAPTFARSDDINLAYAEALKIVDLDRVSNSLAVTRVANGHNCWGGNPDSVCASLLTDYINNWKNGGAGAAASEIKAQALAASEIRTPSGSRPFSASSAYFDAELYQPILLPYCAACHSTNAAVPQQPFFANVENPDTPENEIDLAWLEAQSKLNLSSPASSRMVEYIASGHQTWGGLDYIDAAASITTAIEAMLDAEDKDFYQASILPLLDGQSCLNCHVTNTGNNAPSFANTDIDVAYEVVKDNNLINRSNPSESPLYQRPLAAHRDCGNDCSTIANNILSAIQANSFDFDTSLLHSKAAVIDGDYGSFAASSSGRFDENVIAMYQFKGPEGQVAFDSSGILPAMNLQLSGDVEWVSGYGIRFAKPGFAEATTTSSAKLTELIQASGSYSLEAWLIPANITQEQTRIATYGASDNLHNFMFGQNLYNYSYRNRVMGNQVNGTTSSDNDGSPELQTADDDEIAQTNKQHVVLTFDSTGRKLYVDGQLVRQEADVEGSASGRSLANWDRNYKFRLGAEVDGSNPWRGVIKFFAIHDTALSPEQINANYLADVGLKFLLQFNIAEQLNKTLNANLEHAYIVFEVTQFDEYAYLFDAPQFIVFDESFDAGSGIALEGLHIGLNGKIISVGQAYSKLNVSLGEGATSASGQMLADIGTIVPLEKGVGSDEFFLAFDKLGDETKPINTTTTVLTLTPNYADSPAVDAGLKDFAKINASMSKLTGVPLNNAVTNATYNTVLQQLPTLSSLNTFDAAQQIGIAQLAIEYCNEMMQSDSLRERFFGDPAAGGVDFSQAISMDLDAQIADVLSAKILFNSGGNSLLGNPDQTQVRTLLSELRSNIVDNCDDSKTTENECDSFVMPTTQLFATSYCAALLGSALTTIH